MGHKKGSEKGPKVENPIRGKSGNWGIWETYIGIVRHANDVTQTKTRIGKFRALGGKPAIFTPENEEI